MQEWRSCAFFIFIAG